MWVKAAVVFSTTEACTGKIIPPEGRCVRGQENWWQNEGKAGSTYFILNSLRTAVDRVLPPMAPERMIFAILLTRETSSFAFRKLFFCRHTKTRKPARVWIDRVRLSVLHVVSWTGKMNMSLPAFVPEDLVSRDGFGSPVPRQPAHLHTQAESGTYLRNSSRVPRRRPFIHL